MKSILEYILDKNTKVVETPSEFSKLDNLTRLKSDNAIIQDTSAHDAYIYNTAEEIEQVLGKANRGFDKTKYTWYCKSNNLYFTVYDYKSYPKNKKVTTEYHVGTQDDASAKKIVELLKSCGLHAYIRKWNEPIPEK